jgi:GT2 family glycosyltransferase
LTELSIVIPTRNREQTLAGMLDRLSEQATDASEVLIVDGDATDANRAAVREHREAGLDVRLLEVQGMGAAQAKNVGLQEAGGTACLFLNDDSWPRPGTLNRHLDFHRRHSEPEAGLIGRVVPVRDGEMTPFERWLESGGIRFAFELIEDHDDVAGEFFYTANASAKTSLLQEAGGFHPAIQIGCEDNELGLRLKEHGMRLRYDPDAVVEHNHPADLDSVIRQLRRYGPGRRVMCERHPSQAVPPRPGARHRLKAGALAILFEAGLGRGAVREEAWRFLCDEAHREGYWEGETTADPPLRIGRRLAVIASRDPDARLPATG